MWFFIGYFFFLVRLIFVFKQFEMLLYFCYAKPVSFLSRSIWPQCLWHAAALTRNHPIKHVAHAFVFVYSATIYTLPLYSFLSLFFYEAEQKWIRYKKWLFFRCLCIMMEQKKKCFWKKKLKWKLHDAMRKQNHLNTDAARWRKKNE